MFVAVEKLVSVTLDKLLSCRLFTSPWTEQQDSKTVEDSSHESKVRSKSQVLTSSTGSYNYSSSNYETGLKKRRRTKQSNRRQMS